MVVIDKKVYFHLAPPAENFSIKNAKAELSFIFKNNSALSQLASNLELDSTHPKSYRTEIATCYSIMAKAWFSTPPDNVCSSPAR